MTERDPEARAVERYRHFIDISLRYADLDTLGHINNVAYLSFVETAGVNFLEQAGQAVDGDLGWVTARVELDYLAEARFPGAVRVGSRALEVGRTSCRMVHGLFKDGTVVATCRRVMVLMDRRAGRPAPIGEALRSNLLAL